MKTHSINTIYLLKHPHVHMCAVFTLFPGTRHILAVALFLILVATRLVGVAHGRPVLAGLVPLAPPAV